MISHITNERLDEVANCRGSVLTEDELEHIAECADCGNRAYLKLFISDQKHRPPLRHEKRQEP